MTVITYSSHLGPLTTPLRPWSDAKTGQNGHKDWVLSVDGMHLVTKITVVCLLAFAFALAPLRFGLGQSGVLKIGPALAFAASGSGSEGDGQSDDDDDDDDDESGGGDDDDDDDNDDDEDGSDDDDDGESSGTGSGGSGNGSSQASSGQSSSGNGTVLQRIRSAIVKIEVSHSGIEIYYADGSREEIENGVYERKNTNGKTIEKRRAKGADISRLRAISEGVSIRSVRQGSANQSAVQNVERSGRSIEVTYANGWSEEISNGQYKLVDSYDRTVVMRPATRKDRSRLTNVAAQN